MFRQRFGDGGSGFSVAGHPFLGYRRFDAQKLSVARLDERGPAHGRGDGFFGLGGISVETTRMGQFVTLDADCDRIEIDYLQQPDGGRLGLYDGDSPIEQFSTEGDLGPGFATIETPGGPHHFVLRTLDPKPVRLFGWVADRDAGVTYEALGINGAEAAVMLKWNQDMLATYLQRRNPGLIVLSLRNQRSYRPGVGSAELSGHVFFVARKTARRGADGIHSRHWSRRSLGAYARRLEARARHRLGDRRANAPPARPTAALIGTRARAWAARARCASG